MDTQELEFVLGGFVAWPDEQGMAYLVSFVDGLAEVQLVNRRRKRSIGENPNFVALCNAYAEACALRREDLASHGQLIDFVIGWLSHDCPQDCAGPRLSRSAADGAICTRCCSEASPTNPPNTTDSAADAMRI
jgi:hypothetical protein